MQRSVLFSNFVLEKDNFLKPMYIDARGYAKGKDRGREKKKMEKGNIFMYFSMTMNYTNDITFIHFYYANHENLN